jgi:hypothetical protein
MVLLGALDAGRAGRERRADVWLGQPLPSYLVTLTIAAPIGGCAVAA